MVLVNGNLYIVNYKLDFQGIIIKKKKSCRLVENYLKRRRRKKASRQKERAFIFTL